MKEFIVFKEHTLGFFINNSFQIVSSLISKGSHYPSFGTITCDYNGIHKNEWRYATKYDFKKFRVSYNSEYKLRKNHEHE